MDLSKARLRQGSVDRIAKEEWCDALRDGGAICGDDKGPVSFGSGSRSVDGGSGRFGGPLVLVFWGGAGVDGGGPGASDCGGGVADWMIFRSRSLSRSATLVVRIATFSTRAGSLWKTGGGGKCLAALWRCLTWVVSALMMSLCSVRIMVRYPFICSNEVEFPVV